jgi:hypothetical protein
MRVLRWKEAELEDVESKGASNIHESTINMSITHLQRSQDGTFLCIFVLPCSKTNGWNGGTGVELMSFEAALLLPGGDVFGEGVETTEGGEAGGSGEEHRG